MEDLHQLNEVIGPPGAHRAGAHRVLQRQIPADNPGNQLTQRGIRIGVSGTGQRNHRGELGITQSREGAAQATEHKREHQARPGVVRSQARQHKDTCPDYRPDTQCGQLERSQRALKRAFSFGVGLGKQHVHGLLRKEFGHQPVRLLTPQPARS